MPRIGWSALALLAAFAAVTVPFAAGLASAPLRGLDAAVTDAVIATRTSARTGTALLCHVLGMWPGSGVLVAALVVPLVLLRRWSSAALVLGAWTAASVVAIPLAKYLVDRARPLRSLVVEESPAYPSGHVGFAAVLTVAATAVVSPRARPWVLAVGVAFTALMAWSRIYLGVHWFFDTLGGALLGAGAGLVVWWAVDRWSARRARTAR